MSDQSFDDRQKKQKEFFDSYPCALGNLLASWNMLQERFAMMFVSIMLFGNDGTELERQVLGVWNAVPNDRFQRHMLLEAARATFCQSEAKTKIEVIRDHEKRIFDEIDWLVERADAMGRKRDDAAHVPIAISLIGAEPVFIADSSTEHPIAKKLSSKQLVEEIELYRNQIQTLGSHALAMWSFIGGHGRKTLPKRPTWPTQPRPPTAQNRKAPNPSAKHKRPPRSSPG